MRERKKDREECLVGHTDNSGTSEIGKEDGELKASLDYTARHCLKKINKETNKNV
jgi:hypothetical protein